MGYVIIIMKLADYLIARKLSYAAFARMLGMDSTSAALNVARYAKGERRPRPVIADKIVAVTKGRVKHKDLYSIGAVE